MKRAELFLMKMYPFTIREVIQKCLPLISLIQAKELYHTRCLELERLKRENASPKDVEKVGVQILSDTEC